MAAIKRLLEPLAVHHTDDAYASQGAHRWGNRDIYPIVKKERTYSTWAYFAYWATAGICITSWTLGSSMIGIGLTAGQACGAVLAGSTFASILGFLAGQAGRTLFLRYGTLAPFFIVMLFLIIPLYQRQYPMPHFKKVYANIMCLQLYDDGPCDIRALWFILQYFDMCL